MADFVAVIRKAVDGLANNTPETRGKVYEKARSAVVRQLENMKPRPPEELLNRQIAKLDSAIAEVESEYAEALPALEDDEDDFLPAQEAPYYDDEPQPVETPEEVETGPEVEPETETAVEPQPQAVAYEEPAPAEPEAIEPEEAPEPEQYIEDAQQPPADETHAHADWVGADSPEADDWRAADELPVEEAAPEPELYAGQWTQNNAADDVASPDAAGDSETAYDSGYTSPQQYEQDVQVQISEPRFDTIADDRRALDAAADDIFGTNDPYSATAEPLDFTQERNDRRDEATLGFGAAAGAGAVAGSAAAAGSDDFKRFFDDAIDDSPRSSSSPSGLPRADADPFAQQSEGGKRDAWDDLEDLIGYDGRKSDNGLESSTLGANDGTLRSETTSTIPPNVYVKPKKNRTKEILLAAVALVVIAGGAYALYENRAALNDMVGGLTESAQSDAQPATGDANSATQTGTAQGSPLPSANGDSNNGETTGTKFTQRLLADGTEKDEGPAAVLSNQPVTAEGVSQAEKNAEAAPTPAVEAPAAGATPSTGAAQPAPASQTPAVAVAGERIFLYEEVLGQSAPSAIPGTVAWSLVNEQDANGKSVPTVQAQLNVPERGLTALLTFKKNTDASLPASHIVEVVFSTSGGFEGGAIDSVQRIAMKATEQDRGNALIAVPAKITEDFHMIALNDFPDARKTNMDLLSSRDWLDIPLAYRNGRRALLTLQKGPAGKQAFETALREWQASGSQ